VAEAAAKLEILYPVAHPNSRSFVPRLLVVVPATGSTNQQFACKNRSPPSSHDTGVGSGE